MAFGATEVFKIENGGSVVAQLAVHGAKFWVADESPAHLNYSPETLREHVLQPWFSWRV